MDLFPPNFSPDFSPIKMDPKNLPHHTSFNHSEHPINLLNFDPSWRRPDFLDSPRSIEACLLLGIEQRELLQKNIADLKDEYIPPQFLKHSDEYLDLKLHYSEHIRLQKLGKCIETREKLIEEGQKKEMSYYNPFFDSPKKAKKRSKSPEQASVIAWNLDDELKKVEEFRKKQEGRIESFINSENERMEKRENMYSKLLRIKELEDERTADWHRRREEAKNRSLSRDKLRSEFSPEGKKARHEMLEKEFSKIMTQFGEGESENKKGKKKRRNRAERMKQKAANDSSRTEESVIYTQNKLEFVSQVLAKRREIADKAYDDEIKRKVMEQSAEGFRRNKSENRFHTEKSREESPSFFSTWDQDGVNRSQSRLERDIGKILRPVQKEEHERQVRQRREDQEDLRELVGKLILDQRNHEIFRAEEQKEKIKEINLKKFMYEYLKSEEVLQSIPRDERARAYKGVKLSEKLKNKRDNQERIRIEKQAVYEHKRALETEFLKERSSIKLSFMKEKEKMDYELRERLKSSPKRKSKLKRCKSSTGYKNPKNLHSSSGYESRATAYDSRTQTQDRTYRGGFHMMSIDSHSEMEGERSFERDLYEDIIGENDEILRQRSSKKGHVASRLNIIYEKGQSHIKVPKILKSSSREIRPMLKSQPSERSIRSNQAEAEWVHAEVAKVKKDQVRSLLGLLELEIENNEDSNNKDLEGSAQKILRFIKGQEQEIWKMMRNVNYLDLNPLEKITESLC